MLVKATIIRFEGCYAICMKEDRSILDIKRFNIPMDAKEGDILNINDDDITIKEEETKDKFNHVDDIIIHI